MPTYQYSCTECGHFFETFQNFSDDSLTTCPECEGRLRKVFNAVGVVFKGSGFYRNDSREGRHRVCAVHQRVRDGLRQQAEEGGRVEPVDHQVGELVRQVLSGESGSSSGSSSTPAATG